MLVRTLQASNTVRRQALVRKIQTSEKLPSPRITQGAQRRPRWLCRKEQLEFFCTPYQCMGAILQSFRCRVDALRANLTTAACDCISSGD